MKICVDAGGTNIRLAYVDDLHNILIKKKYAINSFSGNEKGFNSALLRFISDTENKIPPNKIDTLIICAAGLVKNNKFVQFTNSDWTIKITDTAEFLKSKTAFLPNTFLLNDFEALAYGLVTIEEEDVEKIHGRKGHGNTKIVCGAGTGLGFAALKKTDDGRLIVIPSEGGHQSFPSETNLEEQIIRDLNQHFVSYEDILSGKGLKRLFSYFSNKIGGHILDKKEPEEILSLYSSGNQASRKTLEAFSCALGSFCGNMALAFGATKGIYLWGGILKHFPDHILKDQMITRLHTRGKMASYLTDIPVYKIKSGEIALRGCSLYAQMQKNCSVAASR